MARIFNRCDQMAKRQQLRRQMPHAERLLWARLRREACGAKFRRQVSVGPWVLDFYCSELRLALEIDGVSHDGEMAQEYDAARQRNIEMVSVRFLRFSNAQVFEQLEAVVDTVREEVERLRRERDAN